MSVPDIVIVEIVRGQALDFEITVPNPPAGLESAQTVFGLAPSQTTGYAVTLTANPQADKVVAELSSTESAALDKSRYYFSSWVTINGDDTPIARGWLNILSDARNN